MNVMEKCPWNVPLVNALSVLIRSNWLQQFMEVIKLENVDHYREDLMMSGDVFLLQVSTSFPSEFSQVRQMFGLWY